MIVDVYEYFKKHPGYNKLVGSNFLFVEYQCPINVEEFQLWTDSHLITYVINGKKDWITPNKTYELAAGDALFVRKGVYTTKQYLEEDYCVMLFFINDDFIKKFISENDLFTKKIDPKSDHNPIYEIHTDDSFRSLIESIFHYLKQGDKIPQSLIEIKFSELLFNIVLNKNNRRILSFFNTINLKVKANIEDVMNKNFQYDLKLEDFAKLCGRSISAFKRDFNENFKTTPSKWLLSKRLDHAKTLLMATDLSVNEICYSSGFKNNSHFIRSFKNKYKLPPLKFKSEYLIS
jgi:AraC-like DNA-binding protein